MSSIMNGIREQLLSLLALLKAQPHESLIKGWQKSLVLSSLDFGNHLKLRKSLFRTTPS